MFLEIRESNNCVYERKLLGKEEVITHTHTHYNTNTHTHIQTNLIIEWFSEKDDF